jgi:ssDNA thymidine ADP-ribosyltransferase, DarT
MSVPIAFAFDFQKVITLPTAGFVPGNFAKTGAAPFTGDAEFNKMPFDLIYHDSPLTPEKQAEVHNWRMSEVVVADALSLSNLAFVVCRTTHEERSFRHAVGNSAVGFKIIVEQRGSIFMRRGMFIDEIYWASNLLHIRFHGPTVYPQERYSVKVCCWDDGCPPQGGEFALAPGAYHFPSLPASREAIWRIELEGCVVYHAPIPSVSGLVA